jgi:hypothetical protein
MTKKKNKLVVSNHKCEKTGLIFRGQKNQLTTGCKYIEGDPKTRFHQCGHDLYNQTSWCKIHYDVVYNPEADKRIRLPGYIKRS